MDEHEPQGEVKSLEELALEQQAIISNIRNFLELDGLPPEMAQQAERALIALESGEAEEILRRNL